jgi:hypothetical protein
VRIVKLEVVDEHGKRHTWRGSSELRMVTTEQPEFGKPTSKPLTYISVNFVPEVARESA